MKRAAVVSLLLAVAVVCFAGCRPPAPVLPSTTAQTVAVRWPEAMLASHLLVRDRDGRAAIIARTELAAEMRVISEIASAEHLGKIDASGLLGVAADEADAFVELDEASAPASIRDALAEIGFTAGTIAGDVATGRTRLADLGALVAAPWVVRVEFARPLHAR